MADVHTQAQRSYNMSRIKGKDTKQNFISFLQTYGFSRVYFQYEMYDPATITAENTICSAVLIAKNDKMQ